jgi:alpha-D-ribose 1-methylphosphonate 5-triphosphate synthase subunit PhnH
MTTALAPGFADRVLSAQSVFRSIMDAFARPGRICRLSMDLAPPPPLAPAAAAAALTLFDQDTPVWLESPLVDTGVAYWLRFHTGAPVVNDPQQAAFAIISDPELAPPFDAFALGTPDYPDRSATLILQIESFDDGPPLAFRGPGIKDRIVFRTRPVPPDFRQRLAANRALFPRGVDLLLAADAAIAALPRSATLMDDV